MLRLCALSPCLHQAVAADLPALVLRLKTLETVHRGAASFAARLQVRGDDTSPVLSHFATRHSPRAQTGEGVDPCPPPRDTLL